MSVIVPASPTPKLVCLLAKPGMCQLRQNSIAITQLTWPLAHFQAVSDWLATRLRHLLNTHIGSNAGHYSLAEHAMFNALRVGVTLGPVLVFMSWNVN